MEIDVSDISTFHHLTEAGWVEDSTTPVGAVLTFRRSAFAGHDGKRNVSYDISYKDPAVADVAIEALILQFGVPEGSVDGDIMNVSWEVLASKA